MKKIKVSQLPESTSYDGLYTLGVDKDNKSVRVPLPDIDSAVTSAKEAKAEVEDLKANGKFALFIDMWKAANKFYGVNAPNLLSYDDSTGKFIVHCKYTPEYDMRLTYEEALRCYKGITTQSNFTQNPYSLGIRVVLPPLNYHKGSGPIYENVSGMAMYADAEVIHLATGSDSQYSLNVTLVNTPRVSFNNLKSLRAVIGTIITPSSIHAPGCVALEYLLIRIKADCDLQDSPNFRLDCLQYLVTNASNTSPITVTVHPDVYAKLTDTANTDWHAVLTAAADKQISFATTK